jgi:hypothetical protein
MSALDRDAEVLTEVERTDWGADASADWDDRFPERSFVHVEALRGIRDAFGSSINAAWVLMEIQQIIARADQEDS